MADYTTVARVLADIPDSPMSSSTDYNDVLGEMITNASRLIDLEVGGWPSYFAPTTDGETRYFDGSGEIEQDIAPLASLTSVSVAESGGRAVTDYTSWTENTDYYISPYNYSVVSKPITGLIVDNDSGSKGIWYRFRKSVKITGIWGYSLTVPEPIAQACKIQTVRWFMRAKQNYQDASANAQTGEVIYAQSLDPDVKRILQPYKIASL